MDYDPFRDTIRTYLTQADWVPEEIVRTINNQAFDWLWKLDFAIRQRVLYHIIHYPIITSLGACIITAAFINEAIIKLQELQVEKDDNMKTGEPFTMEDYWDDILKKYDDYMEKFDKEWQIDKKSTQAIIKKLHHSLNSDILVKGENTLLTRTVAGTPPNHHTRKANEEVVVKDKYTLYDKNTYRKRRKKALKELPLTLKRKTLKWKYIRKFPSLSKARKFVKIRRKRHPGLRFSIIPPDRPYVIPAKIKRRWRVIMANPEDIWIKYKFPWGLWKDTADIVAFQIAKKHGVAGGATPGKMPVR